MLTSLVCLHLDPWTACLPLGASHLTAVFGMRRSQASLALLPLDVWSSMSTQAGLTLDDKSAVRSSSASLRRLVNAATTKVRPALSLACCLCSGHVAPPAVQTTYLRSTLSPQVQLNLADELQSAFPPGLRPYVQRICVRATSYNQLKGLRDRLSGVPSAAALELMLSFGRKESLNLGNVRTFVRRAGLTERVRAVNYCCKSVLGTTLFPSSEMPVCAELWPGYTISQPAAFWRTLFSHSLVELQITVMDPGHALHGLKSALRCEERICGTLRSLQVDRIYDWQPSLPMHTVTEFLAGLKLPCLAHLGFGAGVMDPFWSGCGWPQKEDVPMLQSFGGTRKPVGIFGLGRSGVQICLEGIIPVGGMAKMAGSALGPAIRELHITVSNNAWTWEALPAEWPFLYLVSLPCSHPCSS